MGKSEDTAAMRRNDVELNADKAGRYNLKSLDYLRHLEPVLFKTGMPGEG